ncbi:MAG TPA: proton-conducting transporter membrane subunit [Acidimicrobiales bacterium]|nr:proton-conducting transporter membrane subunit [Acidimicrobiales bacterium]
MTGTLLEVAALVGLAASAVGATAPEKIRTQLSSLLTAAACGCGLVAAVEVIRTGHQAVVSTDRLLPLSGFSMALDRFGALFVVVGAVVGFCAMVFRLGYDGHGLSSRTASSVLPLFVTTLLLVPAAATVTTFLFLWELMAITSLLLVLVDHRRRPEVQVAGQWYAVMTQLGAAALLLGLVLLAARTGSQSFAAIAAGSEHLPAWVRSSAFVLVVMGFGSKAGMVPLHVWLPRAHPEAPGPVSALMSAAMVNLGIYGIVRVGDGLLGGGPAWWWLMVMALGALSALFGSLHSATSADLKRLLAYSTTDNVGLMLLGVGASGLFASTGHPALALVALAAALLHMVFHAIFKGSLFLSASSIQQATGSRDLDQLGGLLRRMPVTGSLFIVGGLTIAALPPLCGFVSEWLLLQAMLHGLPSSNPALAIAMPIGVGVLALTGGLTALTFVKAIGIGLLGQPRSEPAARAGEVHRSMWVGAGILATLCLAFGVAPYLVIPSVLDAARTVTGVRLPDPLTRGWQVGLSGVSGVLAPGLLALGLLVAVTLVAGARRLLQRGAVRRTEAWGCGRELLTPRMEYTATSFGEPLSRVFEDVLSPAHDLDVSHIAESNYYVEAATFHTSLDDAFERHLYRPTAAGLRRWGAIARLVPNGSIHRYLAFGLVALVVVLVVVG